MKTNLFLISAIAVTLLSSCRKERVCECTVTSAPTISTLNTSTYTNINTYKKTTRKEIKTLCRSYTQVNPSYTSTYDCKIK